MGVNRIKCTVPRKKVFIKYTLLLVFLYAIHVLVMDHVTVLESVPVNPPPVRLPEVPSAQTTQTGLKKILFWTPFISSGMEGALTRCMKKCAVKCDVSTNKMEIDKADAVTFHLYDLWTDKWNINTKTTIKFPSYRRPDQVWILANMEPPSKMYGSLSIFDGLFNWTMWYRTDSNLYFPYSIKHKLTIAEKEIATKVTGKRNYFKNKRNGITGKISNCKDFGRRYRLVEGLRKYLQLDMYGKCYDNLCGNPDLHYSCYNITRTYKFYLALENSRCKDYVTEKYWWALLRNQIPIVNWDYTHINKDAVIPNSFISIHDYPDLKSLSEHIRKVSNNATLYNSYFDWQDTYSVGPSCMSCEICKAMHENRPGHVVENLDAWVQNDTCPKVGVSNCYRISFMFQKLFTLI